MGNSLSTSLRISAAAGASGLSPYTLRYDEQIGLIAPVDRQSGARRYNADDMRGLDFLVHLRAPGMSIRDMQRRGCVTRRLFWAPSTCSECAGLSAHG